MDPRFAVLFEPIEIGPKTLPNRFFQVPQCTGFGVNKPFSQARFRGMKAEGGWGAVFTEECSVHPEGDMAPVGWTRIWDDDDARALGLMCDEVHRHGALAGIELWYGGVHSHNLETRSVSRAPSQIVSDDLHMAPCLEMDHRDIELVQQFYVEAAERARDVGFDVVCLYGGHDGVLEQFLSPRYNKRTDEYGGDFEGRSRFWREVVQRVSHAVGDDCAISVRLAADTFRGPEGIELQRDAIPLVRACDDMVDLWDVYIGGIDWGDDAMPSRFFRPGYSHEWVKVVKEATTKPVVGCGRLTDPDAMVAAIEGGVFDIFGAARPSISDPFLPRKIQEGRVDDIRECIGCNMCIARFESAAPIVCTQNATSGEEYRRGWHPEQFERAANADSDVLVIGAGPAGLECARVLGERGMRTVHLVDGAPEMGGHLNWLTQLPGLQEWTRVTGYRQIQLGKLRNVEFIANTRLSASEVVEYGADLVVIATGSHWSTDGVGPATRGGIEGADASLPRVLTPEQIMVDGKKVKGDRVVIIDGDGYHVAPALADLLSAEGKQVTILTHLHEISPYSVFTLESKFLRRKLHDQGVKLVTDMIPVSCGVDGVVAHYAYSSPGNASLFEADACVLVTQRCSDTRLYREISDDWGPERLEAEGVAGVYRIGDCVAPRVVAEAVFDGHRLAREIDSANPAMPLPYRRERPTVSAGVPSAR